MTEPLPPTPPPTRASATVSAANRYWCAAVLGVLTVVTMAIPTDVIDTPWFGRELPVRWWEYPTLVAVGILTTLWFAVAAPWRGSGTAVGGVTLATLAIGCPLCNKVVLAAIGTTGALGVWAPAQPVLAVVSVALMGGLVLWRWRNRPCSADSCATATGRTAEPTS
ncbi:hypothetical protein MDOR_11980 [Mycolicibacterium doricum]|uniref:Uncharacterized protein n=1 Tax=Mycolicibacterium doricum TaxID=126673 RepID=A0A1X1TG50_9MYCO|nr:hypothetical protein AWC01_06355 [Mycolicibacterium doricum]BBZ07029.1 hypothetical protein MDOR_11980 [Mycolicibacterium doricum]